jgi:hypothetical protein
MYLFAIDAKSRPRERAGHRRPADHQPDGDDPLAVMMLEQLGLGDAARPFERAVEGIYAEGKVLTELPRLAGCSSLVAAPERECRAA